MKIEKIGEVNGQIEYAFECPGDGLSHSFQVPRWTWNGSLDAPTFSPSLLCQWDYGDEHEKRVCHSFVRDGTIEFLGDCTHKLAGKTVPMVDVEEG